MLEQQADTAVRRGSVSTAEIQALRQRMQEAVKTIKTSKLGQTSGAEALYESPWYMTIGNPAAGKSTAVVNSGLKFPFDDGGDAVIKGIGGTRNCDWFFTTEGILLDTAGRYQSHEEDRAEAGFPRPASRKSPATGADQRHHRYRQHWPVDGQFAQFRHQSGQEPASARTGVTEKLEVFAPVYVLFHQGQPDSRFPRVLPRSRLE